MTKPERPLSGTHWPIEEIGEPAGARFLISVEWDLFDGRYEPRVIRVGTRRPDVTGPITGTILRSLPIGRIVNYMRHRVQSATQRQIDRGDEVRTEWREAWERGERPRLGREHYEAVAAVYTAAFAAGASPTKAVGEKFHVSSSTAASWVSRARHKYGLLGATPMGKAGI